MNSLPHQRNHAVVAATAITSIAISLYLYAGRDIINSDGILYLDVSRAFLNEGFTAAMDMFAWPFFSILVGLVHVATGLNLENAALTLNAVFQLFTCLLFVRIYQEVASSDSRPWVAAIVILCFPLLNDYRGMVIRDFGFLVFLLAGLLQFLRYGKSHDWKNAIGWQLFMVLAALFRIEAIAFAAIAPFYFVCRRAQLASNFIDYLRLNSLFLGAILLLALLVAINPELAALELRHTVRLWLDYASLANFLNEINNAAAIMQQQISHFSSMTDAKIIISAGLLALVINELFWALGLLPVALLCYGQYRKPVTLEPGNAIIFLFAFIGLLTLVVFAGRQFFLSGRYTMATAICLLLIVTRYLDDLLLKLKQTGKRKWIASLYCLLLVMLLDGVISGGTPKKNIPEAANWVISNIGPDAKLACNDRRLGFYTHDRCEYQVHSQQDVAERVSQLKQQGYDYFVLWIERELKAELINTHQLNPVREFTNRKNDSVVVYEVTPRQLSDEHSQG
jgi:hypothetical protein